MKIFISEEENLSCLKRRLELEGNEIVGLETADFVISNSRMTTSLPCFLGGEAFSRASVLCLGYEPSRFGVDFYLSRQWDRHSGWLPGVFLSIPLLGLMNGGLGRAVPVGSAGKWVSGAAVEHWFPRPELESLLKELRHSGFVSVGLSAEDGKVAQLETGVPGWGLYSILEGIPRTLEEWFCEPENNPPRGASWLGSLLVSRWPWPKSSKDSVNIGGVTENLEKHFWLGEHERFKQGLHTSKTLIGVASGWGASLRDADHWVRETCRNLRVEQIQYRTDLGVTTGWIYGKVKQWVSPEYSNS